MKKTGWTMMTMATAVVLLVACGGNAGKKDAAKAGVSEKVEATTKEWPKNELTEGLPVPGGKVTGSTSGDVTMGSKTRTTTRVDITWTHDEAKAYYEALKKAGLTKNQFSPEPEFTSEKFTDRFMAPLEKGELTVVVMKKGVLLEKAKAKEEAKSGTTAAPTGLTGWEENKITKELPKPKRARIGKTNLMTFKEKDGSKTTNCNMFLEWTKEDMKDYYELLKKEGYKAEKEPDFSKEVYLITMKKGNTTISLTDGTISVERKET